MESFRYLQNDRLVISKTETLPDSSRLSLGLQVSPFIFFPPPAVSTEDYVLGSVLRLPASRLPCKGGAEIWEVVHSSPRRRLPSAGFACVAS